MFAYVLGQFITSCLVGVFAFTVLMVFKVPGALMLALLAALFDIVPILGFFCSGVPAVLLALSVSSSAAFWVAILYAIYHAIENYFIVPKVYGNRLRLSTLSSAFGSLNLWGRRRSALTPMTIDAR